MKVNTEITIFLLQGNKMNNIDIVYTPWDNLKKTGSMAIGQIGFKDDAKVKKVALKNLIIMGFYF